MASIGTIILAAGASSRFNGCKALAEFDHLPLIQYAINHAHTIADSDSYIVTGAWHQEISDYLTNGDYQGSVLHHQQWQQGIGSSIAFAVKQLEQQHSYKAVIILLADQIAIEPQDLQQLLNAYQGDNISCAYYRDSRGVPAVFPRRCFESLQQLSGDRGAKRLLNGDAFDICQVVMPNAAIDIDTRAELQRWQQRHTIDNTEPRD